MTLRRLRHACLGLAGAVVAVGGSARADEPRSATEPRLLEEPGEVTNVIDSFEEHDAFDINISLGFQYEAKSARITRETHVFAPGLTTGGFTTNLVNVGDYEETTTRLTPRVDIGLYKDLALYARLPIIINNSRRIDPVDGSDAKADVILQGGPGETLFALPFVSPDRSGLEYIAAGLELDIFNQARDKTKPTWLVGVEGRFSAGESMHACNENAVAPEVRCADPSDIDRDGVQDGPLEGNDVSERDPGVTRGTVALELHTIMSKRLKYIEPYGGFTAIFEFFYESSDFEFNDVEASLVNHLPIQGSMVLGAMLIPWENREKFSRVTLDGRFTGTYRSEGRDYNELFDALGSSSAPSIRNPNWSRFTAGPANTSVVDEGSQEVYYNGLADVQAHGSFRGSFSITWQAGEYVKFTAGVGYKHEQEHGLGGDQPCNPDFKDDIRASGPCHRGNAEAGETITSTGIPNPNYRPTINAVGRRFWVQDSNTFDFFASGVVMF